jgi:hypothetical protein
MCEVGEEYKLAALTTHNAVRYLDRVLGATDVPKNRLQLVAMACVLVASKVEEAEEVTPTLAELNECSNHAYSTEALKEMEVAVLRALGWALTVVNPIHFLHFFQARGIVFQGDVSCNHARTYHKRKLVSTELLNPFVVLSAFLSSFCCCVVAAIRGWSREPSFRFEVRAQVR